MKGFRQQAQGGRKEKLRTLDTRLTNLEMSSRITQMMVQQLMQNMKNMQEDLGRSFGLLNELQYKVLAIQKTSNANLDELNAVANELRLKDFNEASDKEDAKEKYTVGTVVDENSIVILTSTTEDKDRGIFRSKLRLATCGVPDLIQAFTGREVGAKAIVKLNEVDHEVELLGIRQPSPESLQADVQPVAADGLSVGQCDLGDDESDGDDESLPADNALEQAGDSQVSEVAGNA
jgi:hypothetical protein